jgi:cytochrome c556
MSLVRSTAFFLVAYGALAACQPSNSPATSVVTSPGSAERIAALEAQVATLGERIGELTPETAVLMAQVQTQHAKLYYAGHAKNWELAAYSLHEINEALQAVQTFNDQFEDFPTPLSELVPSLVGPPLGEIHAAIRTADTARFETAFKSLTAACNACHATLSLGFIQVVTPKGGEFTNQSFAAP